MVKRVIAPATASLALVLSATSASADDTQIPDVSGVNLETGFFIGPVGDGGGPACSIKPVTPTRRSSTPPDTSNTFEGRATATCSISGVDVIALAELHVSDTPNGPGRKIGEQGSQTSTSPTPATAMGLASNPPPGYLFTAGQGRFTFSYDVKDVTLGPHCFRSSARVIVCNAASQRIAAGPRLDS